MKKLCIISTYPPKECGIGLYTKNLVNSIIKRGVKVEVITFRGYSYKEKYVKPILIKNNLSTYFKAADYIKKNNFDKILIQHEYTFYNVFYFQIFLLLLSLSGKKINIAMHTIPPFNDLIKKNIFLAVNTGIALFADRIILHTAYAKNRLSKTTLINKTVKIIQIPINSRHEKPKLIQKNKPVNILCFGFIAFDKGIDIACEALKDLKNIQLNIICSLHPSAMKKQQLYLEKIKAYAKKYSNINLTDKFITEEKKESIFMKNDIILLPYRFIVQSAVLTEAWSYAKIPVCSDILAFREEIQDNRYGILFQNNNPADLKEKILALIKDTKLQKKILENIVEINRERNFDKVSQSLIGSLV